MPGTALGASGMSTDVFFTTPSSTIITLILEIRKPKHRDVK